MPGGAPPVRARSVAIEARVERADQAPIQITGWPMARSSRSG